MSFIGINPPGVPAVLESEERAAETWVRDPHGRSEELRGKRRGRNPHGVRGTLFEAEWERKAAGLQTLVEEDGEEFLVDGGLRPWALLEAREGDDAEVAGSRPNAKGLS